jgi:hypothetical protein
MQLPSNKRSVSVGNNVFENLYVYGDCKFFKNVDIGGKLTTDKIDASTLDLESLPELP